MPFTEEFDAAQQLVLLQVALASIKHGLKTRSPLLPDINEYDVALRHHRASFITLTENDELRGCIGALEASEPLVTDVARHAFAAAFEDPRFPPLHSGELAQLKISVSVLSARSPMQFKSEADLLSQIRPGIDGLILEDEHHRGTFLPSVWESLPTADFFLQNLKQKAGLPADYWSDTIKVSRYTTFSFSETVKNLSA